MQNLQIHVWKKLSLRLLSMYIAEESKICFVTFKNYLF